jgi:ABC-2 type transport system ATP-binding protein
MLEARELTKRYRSFAAARDISFTIRPGDVLGLLGPNGAGKSTIVKMLTALVEPTQGFVLFKGERIGSDLSSYKSLMGYVPEQPDLYGFLTGWEYLDMVATLRGIDRRTFRTKASALLEGLTLYAARDNAIATYSKGMRQRVVVIAALLHDPELLILDEPFSGLDVTSAMVLRRTIELLARQGKAVLFSSPVMEQVDRLCTHLVVLKRGSVVAAGSMADLQQNFAGLDLEAGFMQLTEQVDTDAIARSLVAAVTAPAR